MHSADHLGNREEEQTAAMERTRTPATLADHASAGASDGGPPPATASTVTTRIELPTRTIVKVVLTLAILWLLGRLWTLLLLLFIALLLAAALDPVVGRLERRGWPRAASVTLIVVLLVAVIAAVGLVLIPPVIDEGQAFAAELPAYVDRAEGLLDANPELVERLREAANRGSADPQAIVSRILGIGAGVISGIANVLVLLVLTVYLLVDGERIVDWVLRYVPQHQRVKVRQAMPEISKVVSGYVVGQLVTSAMFGLFTFGVLTLVGVPQPVLLALLAALMDAIPIAGILIATVPAALLALTESWMAAAIVVAAYFAYQQVENYLIVPRVYRGTLQISSFAVLVAVLVGGQLLGILGVLLALPVAATFPVIERIWRGEPAPPEP